MSQRQQNLRYAAARAFMESLDQLQETLQSTDDRSGQASTPPPGNEPPPTKTASAEAFDLSSFEQAVADIDAFIQRQHDEQQRFSGKE